MDQLKQTLQSYLNWRNALLRKLNSQPPSDISWFLDIGMTTSTRLRRVYDPTTWRLDELAELAKVAGMSNRTVSVVQTELAQLKNYIDALPDRDRQRFYATSQLSNRKIMLRQRDPLLWRTNELENVAAFLHKG